jgi:membrane protein implicated in regulation of membrane protease activity
MLESSLGTLNCVYFALFFVGLGYAIFIVITGGLSSIDMPDVDIDIPQIDLPGDVDIPGADIHLGGPDIPAGGIDTPDVSVSPLSPITIASFVTSFGGIGVLATQFFEVDPRISLLWATGGAVIISGLMFLFYSQVLIRAQGSSEVRRGELIGLLGEVTVPIGETATGQVTYSTKAGRMSSMARSADGSAIPRGQFVKIVRMIGQLVIVKPIEPGAAEENTPNVESET